jgi:hypothetical protein
MVRRRQQLSTGAVNEGQWAHLPDYRRHSSDHAPSRGSITSCSGDTQTSLACTGRPHLHHWSLYPARSSVIRPIVVRESRLVSWLLPYRLPTLLVRGALAFVLSRLHTLHPRHRHRQSTLYCLVLGTLRSVSGCQNALRKLTMLAILVSLLVALYLS